MRLIVLSPSETLQFIHSKTSRVEAFHWNVTFRKVGHFPLNAVSQHLKLLNQLKDVLSPGLMEVKSDDYTTETSRKPYSHCVTRGHRKGHNDNNIVKWLCFMFCVRVCECVCICVRLWVRECVCVCLWVCVHLLSTQQQIRDVKRSNGDLFLWFSVEMRHD